MNEDREHLRLLSIFHYLLAALTALCTVFPLGYLVLGIAFAAGWGEFGEDPPPAFVGWIICCAGGFFVLLGLTYAVCLALAGRYLVQHRSWVFCMVIAGINCTIMPVGTILGIFTMIVLNRPSVRALFEGGQPA